MIGSKNVSSWSLRAWLGAVEARHSFPEDIRRLAPAREQNSDPALFPGRPRSDLDGGGAGAADDLG